MPQTRSFQTMAEIDNEPVRAALVEFQAAFARLAATVNRAVALGGGGCVQTPLAYLDYYDFGTNRVACIAVGMDADMADGCYELWYACPLKMGHAPTAAELRDKTARYCYAFLAEVMVAGQAADLHRATNWSCSLYGWRHRRLKFEYARRPDLGRDLLVELVDGILEVGRRLKVERIVEQLLKESEG